ncbi:ribonuclease HII [Candidatus Woesearchaeota archaeon]|nr:ribonuclease HII [Candidatus Woesearchaeota archaeon]
MIIAGVEEAGRGPVIGPMVMTICAIEEEKIPELKRIGVKDSKLITPSNRKIILEKIKNMCYHETIIIEPGEIDDALNNEEMNLNKLEGVTSANLINELQKKITINKTILDCPSNNIKAYKEYVSERIKNKTEIIAEHKADLNHVIVGAASIIAKVTRDEIIEEIKKQNNIEFGSGYPSDPRTIDFLKKNWNKYDFFRKTWSTYKKVAMNKTQKALNEY